ncbi:NADH:flavin oxidoreductase/NADH oxidase [Brevibacillus nitrificans]|uniref:NADH:flavin oxidoreductase/NADH oxidase n=1 Tax=Brevibacillus nitrificans TaxID=651560 RepID=A0A3M8DKH3_9BACL|nr:NADH:flavin oxidoreductase/NADH oxidase [Brevibacillus nitrificans]RNB88524.1 NADH:flavin oxidoreductase/NADH oxidase [Brevibacillus nitrificans]
MSHLGSAYTIKGLTLQNRIVMPPMCQYSAEAKVGSPNDWHFVHYVSRAVGGTGLIIMEMTDIDPYGGISDHDLGLWSDAQIPAFARVIAEVQKYGTKIGVQIAHSGRKAEVPVAPSAIPLSPEHDTPRALTTEEVKDLVKKFKESARRAVEAGMDTLQIHAAHGYLIHQFHSPSINKRDDEYGRDRARFGLEVIEAFRSVMPEDMPLIMRISAIEYMEGGYDLEYSIDLARRYQEAGVDMFDVSSGGEAPLGKRKPGNYPGYQVPFAKAFKEALNVPVIAVGMLDDPALAEETIAKGEADLIAVGRSMLRDPYWAFHALKTLEEDAKPPMPYRLGY